MRTYHPVNILRQLCIICLIASPVARAGDTPSTTPSQEGSPGVHFPCFGANAEISGIQRTDESWLRDYLDLEYLKINSQQDIETLRSKIMTTDIFTTVDLKTVMRPGGICALEIAVLEKWTRIPVIRGVYGGGTPLLIAGGYETNAFGRLLAIGGEVRRYGNRPPGAFLFFKSPRAWRGLGLWGGEMWLDRRRRSFYDQRAEPIGYADSESLTGKFQWLYPVSQFSGHGSLQAGFHVQISRESPSSFSPQKHIASENLEVPRGLHLNQENGYGGIFGAILALDNLEIYGLNMNGIKGRALVGLSRSPDQAGTFSETEWFGYKLLPSEINLAGHMLIGSTTSSTLSGAYFLGGFDSIRGLPDGIHFGSKIAYANIEARIIAAKFEYAHIQPALFVDTGTAWIDGEHPNSGRETSMGAGVRIAIPQVYRLVIRIDYGVSVGTTKSRGLSIGLNQFFQPYKLFF